MKFDFKGDIPLFQQVANQLEEEIFHKSTKRKEIKYRRQLKFPQDIKSTSIERNEAYS